MVRQAAVLSVLSDQLQAQLDRDEPVCAKTVAKLPGQLRRILAELRQRTGQRGPAPPSIHEHRAAYGTTLDADDLEIADALHAGRGHARPGGVE